MISEWDTNGDTHTAHVKFDENAKYDWSVSYQNKAGLKNSGVTETGDYVYDFTVDNSAPSLELKYKNNDPWKEIIKTITFGILIRTM